MVERVSGIFHRRFEVIEMDDDASLVVWLTVDRNAHAERMSMYPRIGVARRRRRKQMSGFESEFLIDTHGSRLWDFAAPGQGDAYGSPNSLCVWMLKRHLGWARQ